MGPGEGPPDLIGLGGGHPRHVHDELDHLLLPDDDAVAPLQSTPLQRMVVLPGCTAAVPLHKLGDGAALDADAGTDEGHLIGQVQEGAGPEALPHFELGGGLEQEDTLGVALVDHVVHTRVLGVDPAQVQPPPLPLFDEVKGFLQALEPLPPSP